MNILQTDSNGKTTLYTSQPDHPIARWMERTMNAEVNHVDPERGAAETAEAAPPDQSTVRIVLKHWRDCDAYTTCSLCGGDGDEDRLKLRRDSAELFNAVTGKPVCHVCADKHSPQLTAIWANIRSYEYCLEEAIGLANKLMMSEALKKGAVTVTGPMSANCSDL